MTGGEGGHEDVDTSVIGLILFQVGIDHFERVVVGESDLMYVIEWVRYQGKEMMCCVDSFGGGFVEILAKFTPEAVEHEFGSGLASGVFDDEVGVEVNVFPLPVLVDIVGFVCLSGGPGRVASGLLFDFEPGVDVFGKESDLTSFWREVVDFVNLDESVPKFDGFLYFGGAPGPSERALFGGVLTVMRFFQERFGHFFFHAGLTEREGEFALVSVWQDGMIQSVGR